METFAREIDAMSQGERSIEDKLRKEMMTIKREILRVGVVLRVLYSWFPEESKQVMQFDEDSCLDHIKNSPIYVIGIFEKVRSLIYEIGDVFTHEEFVELESKCLEDYQETDGIKIFLWMEILKALHRLNKSQIELSKLDELRRLA